MVMFGPSLRILATATHTPTSAAMIGMVHTSESLVCFLGTALDSGMGPGGVCGSAMCNLAQIGGVPDQSRVERLDRQHRQYYNRREEKEARPRLHRHQRLKLDQRGGKGVDEHVNHRPASDELDDPVHPDALPV